MLLESHFGNMLSTIGGCVHTCRTVVMVVFVATTPQTVRLEAGCRQALERYRKESALLCGLSAINVAIG